MGSGPAFLEGSLVFELSGFRDELGLFCGLFQQEPTKAPWR